MICYVSSVLYVYVLVCMYVCYIFLWTHHGTPQHVYPSLPSVALFLYMLCIVLELVDLDRGGQREGEGMTFKTSARTNDATEKRSKPLNVLAVVLTVLCLF